MESSDFPFYLSFPRGGAAVDDLFNPVPRALMALSFVPRSHFTLTLFHLFLSFFFFSFPPLFFLALNLSSCTRDVYARASVKWMGNNSFFKETFFRVPFRSLKASLLFHFFFFQLFDSPSLFYISLALEENVWFTIVGDNFN